MSDKPEETIENEPMDEIDFEEAFLEIQNLHTSFDENNPITYQILLTSYGERLNEAQKQEIELRRDKAIKRKKLIHKKILKQIDNEITRSSILEKVKDSENFAKQII